ncbi:MAG: VWA domain-containing protein [Planctomycetes bacterium]|nr:VWA domain-containing protein [Planctomycetota bacterium]
MRVLLALVLLVSGPQEERKPKGLAGVGLRPEDVNRAIDRGVEFLRKHYATNELTASNEDLISILAFIHADAHRRHKDVGEKVRATLKGADPRALGTYELGVLAMILESYGDPQFVPMLQTCVQRLLDGQGPAGSWTYGGADAPSAKTFKTGEKKPARLRVTGGKPLDRPARKGEVLKKAKDAAGEDGNDNSSAQYAVLGLYSGHRAGLSIDPEAFEKALKFYLEGQSEDGGWGYGPLCESYGSMACAGVASAAIGAYVLGRKDWKDQPAVKKGLAWLGAHFKVDENPPQHSEYHYYYLYGLERVGRILDTEFIGDHEWYPLGAKYLVGAQLEDGSWKSDGDRNEVLATGFALLFLTRATPSPLMKPPKRGGKGTLVTAASTGTGNYHVILDASGSMQRKMGEKTKFQIAKDAVCAIVEAMPAGAKMGLRVYGHHRIVREEDAERDTELLIPFGPLDKAAFAARVKKLDCFGRTPLTLSLQECVKDLDPAGRDKVTVILLTDGGESTRGADPAAVAAELVKARPNAIVHVVAFDVNDRNERRQCEAISKSGRGMCFAALKADELVEQLKQIVATKLTYELADKGGKKIADGVFGDRRELPEGAYRFRCVVRGEKLDEEIWINTDEVTTVTVDLAEERPVDPDATKREMPGEKKGKDKTEKTGLDLKVDGKAASAADLRFTFAPPADEEGDGMLTFEGPLAASFPTKARKVEALRGIDLAVAEGATITLDAERTLAAKEATLKITGCDKGVLTGTIVGTFVLGEKEVRVTGTFRAAEKKDER